MTALTRSKANQIIEAAFAKAREMQARPLGVVVVDASGDIISAQREDGASMFRIDVSRAKAWGAVGMGTSGRGLAARAKDNPNFLLALAHTAGGKLLPQPGGVLIRGADGTLLGAAGASGGAAPEDEAVCVHGITVVGFQAEA